MYLCCFLNYHIAVLPSVMLFQHQSVVNSFLAFVQSLFSVVFALLLLSLEITPIIKG